MRYYTLTALAGATASLATLLLLTRILDALARGNDVDYQIVATGGLTRR